MKLPEIKGFIGLSLVDWDGKVSAVLFLPHCNFRCPFCYNLSLVLNPEKMQTVPFEMVERYLTRRKSWLDGVAITGGEPTIHGELPELCSRLKELGLAVKLDTNGSNPQMLQNLVASGLVDYVAVDIKAPLTRENYSAAVGVEAEKHLAHIEETINILLEGSIEYEFRTTLVPTIHTIEDVRQICARIRACKKFVLQNFKENVDTIDSNFKNITPFSSGETEEFLRAAKEILPNTFLR